MIGRKVLGIGPVPCDVMLIGEGPGKQESLDGVPFCGAAGSELDWVFLKRAAGLRREDVYVTNLVKYRTDEKDSDPTEDDIKRDEEELQLEIAFVNPKIVVAIGRIAGSWLYQSNNVDLEKLHGTPVRCPRYPDKTLLIAYHPAAGLHSPERYYSKIFWDFEQLGRLIRGEIGPNKQDHEPAYELLTKPSVLDGWNGSYHVLAVDTEGSVSNPWGLSLSCAEGSAYVEKKGNSLANGYVENSKVLVAHHALHDIPVLAELGHSPCVWDDTMLMAYLLPWLPRGLKPLAFKLCGMEMQSYEEIVSDAEEKITKDYYERVLANKCKECNGSGTGRIPYKRDETKFKTIKCVYCGGDGTNWPKPAPQILFDKAPTGRVYIPRSIGNRLREILHRGTGLRAAWGTVDEAVRTHIEGELGPLREPTLDDIPIEQAIHYSARDADATLRVYHKLEPILKKEGLWPVYEIDKAIIPIVNEMQQNGILIDKEYFEFVDTEFAHEQLQVEERLQEAAGQRINPASSKQVSNLLYNQLGLKGQSGSDSTDEKTLEALKIKYTTNERASNVIDLIRDHRELTKLRGTYVQPLPAYCDANGRIHTQFILCGTSSGRLASKEPNLQNQPTRTERGKLVRGGFIAQDGYSLVSVDLDQIELRVAAHMSEDDAMIEVFRTGKDIHRATAAMIYGKPMEQITTQERLLSKTINFLILYGGQAGRLFKELTLLGITVTKAECQNYINGWFRAYPGVEEYINRTQDHAKRTGYVECLYGRRRYVQGVWSTIDKVKEESLRWASNHPIQATAAAILKLWMRRVWVSGLLSHYARALLTVHDELIFEVKHGLEKTFIDAIIAEALKTVDLLVPINSKGAYGRTWAELK